MAKFVNNVLRLTDRIFNFVGGERHVSLYDLKTPIVRVHDVGREAQLGTYAGDTSGSVARDFPFFTINHDVVSAMAETRNDAIGVYSNQSPTWALATWDAPDPLLETVWVLGVFVNSSATAVSRLWVGLDDVPKAGAGAGESPIRLIFGGDVDDLGALASGQRPIVPFFQNPYPLPITNKLLNNSPLNFNQAVSAAVTVDYFVRCIRLPVGVFPPGMS